MAGEQLRLAKAREVADLGADSRRRERVDASKAAEARDQLGIGALGHQLADRSIEHSASLREAVDGDQVVDEARLGREVCKAQGLKASGDEPRSSFVPAPESEARDGAGAWRGGGGRA